MPLKSMKITKKESKVEEVGIERPKYPYGLSLRLNEESITKLGISEMPEVGNEMSVIAIVTIEEVSEREVLDGKKQRNISLQITEMSLEKKIKKDVLKTLYG